MAYRGTRLGKARAKTPGLDVRAQAKDGDLPTQTVPQEPTPKRPCSRGRRSVGSSRSTCSSEALSLDNIALGLGDTDMWGGHLADDEPVPPQSSQEKPASNPTDSQARFNEALRKGIEAAVRAMELPSEEVPGTSQGTLSSSQGQLPHHLAGQSETIDPLSDLEDGQIREEGDEFDFSDDESLAPEPTPAVGLFQPALFRTLLHKARATANLKSTVTVSEAPQEEPDPFFGEPTAQAVVIPTPKLFLDAIEKQGTNPAAGPLPSQLDKKLFPVSPQLSQRLLIPKIDGPVLALYTSNQMPGDAEELLKPDERRTDVALQRAHQSSAWAIKAATSASFFARTSLKWLSALQEHIPAADVRAHQDITKLLAAARYMADATLQATRFSARAMGGVLVARRFNWLRNWSGDARTKWKLASAPLAGQLLFGSALDTLLVENKDKKKVLPSSSRKATGKTTQFPRRGYRYADNQFRGFTQPTFPRYNYRARGGSDRGYQRGVYTRKPFRAGGGRTASRAR